MVVDISAYLNSNNCLHNFEN